MSVIECARRRQPRSAPFVARRVAVLLAALLAAAAVTCCYSWSWRAPTAGRVLVAARRRAPAKASSSSRWTQQRQLQQRGRHGGRTGAGGLQCSGIQGWGRVGERYSWVENEWELEVTVPVPPGTSKEDVLFKASPTSLQLALAPNATGTPLLGGTLKGRITIDGSYWSLEGEGEERAIKLLLEKKAGALENAWDWRRVLADEPATESDYQEPERFDTKAYTRAMLGPDGIDMSLVDKDMFASGGLFQNVTADTLKDYFDAGVLDDASGLFPKKQRGQEEEEGGEEETEEE